ncbi:MAG: response regulator [Gammaproteobacteria bacterium]|nr:response regulator [Gammaproteobacteria bacterium]
MKIVRSVLIVDDVPADVEWCKMMLEASGGFASVMVAKDGSDAINLYENYEESRRKFPEIFPPLLILLDIAMPGLDGFEFLERYEIMRTKDARLDGASVVVMLTSSDETTDRQRASEFPIVKDYVVKPLSEARARELADIFGS